MKSNGELEFKGRFEQHDKELKRCWDELYYGDSRSFEALKEMLRRAWEERPDKLKDTDRRREKQPGWYRKQDLTGFRLDAGAFRGSLRDLAGRLEELAEQGVNCLFLTSVLEDADSRQGDQYAVSSFRKIRPELGTTADLAELADRCWEKGMLISLDLPMHHTGSAHEWAARARAGEKEYQDRYLFFGDRMIPAAFEQTMRPGPVRTQPGHFTWCGEAGKLVMTTFRSWQWDLNYANPAVFLEMAENLLYLCNRGMDILRLEGLPWLWKAPGTACFNLQQSHTLVRMFRMICDTVCPGVLLLGEADGSEEAAAWAGTAEKPECHLLADRTGAPTFWHTAATRDARLLAHRLRKLIRLPKACFFLNDLRNGEELRWNLDYGFLAGQGQQEGPHRAFLNDYFSGRWEGSPAKGILTQNEAGEDEGIRGTAEMLCGLRAAEEPDDPEGPDRAARLEEMLHALMLTLSGMPVLYDGDEKAPGLRRLEELRKKLCVFSPEADVWLPDPGSDHLLAIGRYARGEQLLALFNFADTEETARLYDAYEYTDQETGTAGDAGMVPVPARGYRWLIHRF